MPLVQTRVVSLPSPDFIKMEERKRPAIHDQEDLAPPHKKQATSVNGASKAHVDTDMPWQDDLERFQKEAIWRQMQEYKRERNALEVRLSNAEKMAQYHDDHIRFIDGWFGELLDEIRLLVGEPSNNKTFKPFPTALLNVDSEQFKAHLGSRSSDISSAISKLFARAQSPASEVPEVQARLAQLLAAEKAHITELEKNRQEKTKLEERLEDAAFRYMIAEKKLDRSKSATVAKLEKQAICGGRSESGSGLGGNREESGNQKDLPTTNSEDFAAVDLARREAEVESQKRKEQLETLGAENHKLTTQLTTLNIQLSTLTDEEYSKTDLFKQVRSQLEDSIRRVNDLEATNIQLREEAERLHAERTSYKVHVEHESATAIGERERMLSQAEVDLARIRTNRDDLNADIAMRKAAFSQEKTSVEQVKELASAKDHRIYTLESEVARLQSNHGQDAGPATPPQSLDGLSPVEIQSRYVTLEKQHGLLNNELESMQVAFSKANKLASQKVNAQSSLEEKVQRLSAEKSKADQKYFAAMKAKEAREQEVRTLRAQNAKSSEMVTSLKEAETANRALQVVSDKQNAEAKESILNISAKLKLEQQALTERILQIDGLKSQLEELKKNLTAKDEHVTSASTACRQAEVEIESLKVKLEETEKSRESWKAKGLGNQSSEYEMLRHLAICTVCRANFKDTALKTCGHVFCKDCVDERTASRSRKCPNCNRSFGAGDVMRITL